MSTAVAFTFEHRAELGRVLSALSPPPDNPSLVLLEGEHGIGRTTLWRAAIETLRADGVDVRVTSCTPSDAPLSLMALAELLSPIEGPALQALPDRLRATLVTGAFRRAPDRPIEPALLVAATRRFVEELASATPVVLAIDDLQWLDRPSSRVLGAALQQVGRRTRVAILATVPDGELPTWAGPVSAIPPEWIARIHLPKWSRRALGRLLRERVGSPLTRRVEERIVDAAHGNPSFAIEIARGVIEHGDAIGPDDPLPVADDLRGRLSSRLAVLPARTRQILLFAALSAHPTLELIARAAPGTDVVTALAPAITADIAQIVDGDVRFEHPLLGSLLIEGTPQSERQAGHRRLAAVAGDAEERARHLALSTTARTGRIADAIEEGARWSRARGTPSAAADLFAAAAEHTPLQNPEDVIRRRHDAVRNLFAAGRPTEALTILRDHHDASPNGRERIRMLLEVGRRDPHEGAVVRDELEACLAGDEPQLPIDLESELRTFLAWVHLAHGSIVAADRHARAAITLAERAGDEAVLAAALASRAYVELRTGHLPDRSLLDRVLSLDVPRGRFTTESDPHAQVARLLASYGDHATATRVFRQRLVHARASGDAPSVSRLLWWIAMADLDTGQWSKAERRLTESVGLDREMGIRPMHNLAMLAWLHACLGRDGARRYAEEAAAAAAISPTERSAVVCEGILGSALFHLGEPAEAAQRLTDVMERIRALGQFDPMMLRFMADRIEANVAMGQIDGVRRDSTQLVRRSRALGPPALATAVRAAALVRASDGDLDRAHRQLSSAVAAHAAVGEVFEHGRSLLALGSVQRRMRRHGAARATIDEAVARFEPLAAEPWLERCERERARVSGRTPSARSITDGDRQIVGLVCEGLTNDEIARRLFMSVSTVETHLHSIYRTLEVRSRAQLIAKTLSDDRPRAPSPG